MNLKTRRMNHIFKEDGKALIVAMITELSMVRHRDWSIRENLYSRLLKVEQMQYFVTLVWQENLQKNWHH